MEPTLEVFSRQAVKALLCLFFGGVVGSAACSAPDDRQPEPKAEERQGWVETPLLGLAACDAYVDARIACLEQQFPQHQAQQAANALRAKQARWVELADTDFKRESLGRMCNDKVRAAARIFPNCSWSTGPQ